MQRKRSRLFAIAIISLAALLPCALASGADTPAEIDRDVDNALEKLYADSPAAKRLATVAHTVLVFPNVVKAKSLTTTTAKDDIYAFFFSHKGLMAGLGIQGSKISRVYPEK